MEGTGPLGSTAILDALPEAILVVAASGRIVHVNHAAERLLDRPAWDLVGHQLSEVAPGPWESPDPVPQEGQPRALERRDGSVVWIEWSRGSCPSNNGESLWVISLRSVRTPELKPLETEDRSAPPTAVAEAAERRDYSILDLIPVGVVVVEGPLATIQLVNSAGRRIWGRDFSGYEFKHYAEVAPALSADGSTLEAHQRPLWRAFYHGERVRQKLHCEGTDGKRRVIEVNAAPLPGERAGAIATFQDITERVELQSDLATRAAQLKALLDHLPVGVAYFDVDCRCRACNGPAWRILGRSRSEIIGLTAEELFVDAPGLLRAVRFCVNEHAPHAQVNAPWAEVPGGASTRYLDWRFEPLSTSSEPIGALALIVDVTARKQSSDKMKAAKEAAELSAQNKSRFLSAISHDLRTPINALNLLASMLKKLVRVRQGDEELAKLVKNLDRASSTLVEMVNDLLDLTSFDSGALTQRVTEFELRSWLEAMLGPLEETAKAKPLDFRWSLEGPNVWVRADRVNLGRVVTNLVGNAIKFTEQGGVEVTVHSPVEGELRIRVEDTGSGIPAEQLERIFDEFAQLRNPERDRSKGTGLGLAIARRLVEAVGGRMEVHSRLGAGSRFTVTYPVRVTAEPRPAVDPASLSSEAAAPIDDDKPLVLLVEDDETTRGPMVSLLEISGYEVEAVADGESALAALRLRRPAVVLLDLMMPKMDGIEVLRRIRDDEDLTDLPVLILSGDMLEERIGQLNALGVSGTLSKPIDFDALLQTLGQALSRAPAQTTTA